MSKKRKKLIAAINGVRPCVIKWHPNIVMPVALDAYHITVHWAKNKKEHGTVIYK